MISPKSFSDKWNKDVFPLVEYAMEKINPLSLPKDSKDFLIEAGLPESAAPFVNFKSSFKGGGSRLNEKFKECKKFSHYIYLGFTGNGDPICIVENTGEVVYLDHEDGCSETFINSSIQQLAESLLEYSEFIKKIKQANGKKAFLEKSAPKDLIDWVYNKLSEIDSKSLEQGCFWNEEIDLYSK